MSIRPVNVKPLGNRVLSRLLPPDQLSSLIFTPHIKDEERAGSASFRTKPAVVVAVGDGRRDPLTGEPQGIASLKPGDEILLPIYPGTAVPLYGFDDETNEVVEIRDSRLSDLFVTDFDQIVCKRERG
jgi:co-chaperonin GroES (HSP10)